MRKTLKSKILSIILGITLSLGCVVINTEVAKAATVVTEEVDGVKWSYTIVGDNAVDVYPTDKASIEGDNNFNNVNVCGKNGENITSVTIPENLGGKKVASIAEDAFAWCENLESIRMPNSVASIGQSAFANCTSLVSINISDGITIIGENLFYNCTSLTSINIPDGVTSIGSSTFCNCTSLKNIDIPAGVTTIGHDTFYGCISLTSINIPAGVTSIGDDAFFRCTSLTSINIPDGVTSIGGCAFFACTSLTSINIPRGVTSIEHFTFSGCTSLTNIIIPDSVVSIGYAFSGCTSLTNISIPDSVTSIESSAFDGCTNLKNIYANSNSIASTYGWKTGIVDSNTGYLAGSLIVAKANAKIKSAEINSGLSRYILAGGRNTDTVYLELITVKGIYTKDSDIEAEIDINKLISWASQFNVKIEALNAKSQEMELITAKNNAKSSLEIYKNLSTYTTAQQTVLVAAIANGKTAIDSATTIEEVATALNNAKSIIDVIKTDEQLIVEEKNNSLSTIKTGDVDKLPLVALLIMGMTGIIVSCRR